MPRKPSTRRASLIGGELIAELNGLAPGLGTTLIDQLNQRFTAVNTRMATRAGDRGTVNIAKQPGAEGVGLHLAGQRLSGVAIPQHGSDAINLDYLRRFLTCDFFAQMFDDCVELEELPPPGGVSAELFTPHGFAVFANTDETLAYYAKSNEVGGRTNDERAGAVGVIDITDLHAPQRIGYIVLCRQAGPIAMAVDEPRAIVFVTMVVEGGSISDTHLITAVDCSIPTLPTVIGQTFHVTDFSSANHFFLGNKTSLSTTTFGYFITSEILDSGSGQERTQFTFDAWDLTDPASMTETASVDIGGYHSIGAGGGILSGGLNGYHYKIAMDRRGTGTIAVNLSVGDETLSFGGPLDLYLNLWDVSSGTPTFLDRTRLGTGVFPPDQEAATVVWGMSAFALAALDDQTFHLFAIDCGSGTPIVRTDTVVLCTPMTNLSIREDCLYVRASDNDLVIDVSDLSNLRVIGGCQGLLTGTAFYNRNMFQITMGATTDPDNPAGPKFGFVIQHFTEHGVTCG